MATLCTQNENICMKQFSGSWHRMLHTVRIMTLGGFIGYSGGRIIRP